jgi:hypothetical protein
MDDCAGPASREVLLGHLSCPHSPDLARIQATLVVADNSSVDAVFNKRGGRFDSVFFLIEAPCIRLGARIVTQVLTRPQLHWTTAHPLLNEQDGALFCTDAGVILGNYRPVDGFGAICRTASSADIIRSSW